MFGGHVSRELSAYRQNELSADRAARVAAHLERCAACRRELEEIAFGIQLAERLPLAPAPEEIWSSVAGALGSGRTAFGTRRFPAWGLAAAAVLLVAVAAGAAWYVILRHPLDLHPAAVPPSEFELAAIAAHARRVPAETGWGIQTSDIARIRSWVKASSNLTADDIPIRRPREDAGHLRVVGARLAHVGSATAAVIGYEMDEQPVTLATARIAELPDPPPEGLFSKNVAYRVDAAHGYRILTWGVGRHAYVMVSGRVDLKGCYLCHTTPERRRMIDGAKLEGN